MNKYLDPLTKYNYNDIVSGADKLSSMRMDPRFLDQLNEDWLARKGFDPNRIAVHRGIPEDIGVNGFMQPKWEGAGGKPYKPNFGGGVEGYSRNVEDNQFPAYYGGTAVVVSPTGALNRQEGFDTLKHELRHRANADAGVETGSAHDEQIANYLDTKYEKAPDIEARNWRLQALGLDPKNPPQQVSNYVANVDREKAASQQQQFIPQVDTLKLMQDRMNQQYPMVDKPKPIVPDQYHAQVNMNYRNPLSQGSKYVEPGTGNMAQQRNNTVKKGGLRKYVDANGITRYSTGM